MAVGQERRRSSASGVGPSGFRKAQRAFEMAGKFSMPVITLIDSIGPDVSLEAEEQGLGRAIAKTIADLSGINSPTIAVVIGEGGSEAALAFGVADRVLMMGETPFTRPSPPRRGRVEYTRTKVRAGEVLRSLKLTAHDCRHTASSTCLCRSRRAVRTRIMTRQRGSSGGFSYRNWPTFYLSPTAACSGIATRSSVIWESTALTSAPPSTGKQVRCRDLCPVGSGE